MLGPIGQILTAPRQRQRSLGEMKEQAWEAPMCDYCDCREVAPIGELSLEHETISELAATLRQRLVAGGEASAELAALQHALAPHLRKEEQGLFAELERRKEFAWYLERLSMDHARARAGLLGTTSTDGAGADGLLAELGELQAHIEMEEYDFFPASRLILDDASWATVDAVHRRLDVATPGGPAPSPAPLDSRGRTPR